MTNAKQQEVKSAKGTLGAGINLKSSHYDEALADNTRGLWFEVHTENYLVKGGPRLNYLQQFSEKFPLSFHGVGASLGRPMYHFQDHLKQVANLVKTFDPILVSEHATWSGFQNHYYADLLPLPKTMAVLQDLCDGIDAYQNAIKRTIAIENPSNYLTFSAEMDEPEFLLEVTQRTGCQLLIDINNLHISANNCGLDPYDYLQRLDPGKIVELHIAGFDADPNHHQLLIDSHGSPVSEFVWDLMAYAIEQLGHKPILLERDDNIPDYVVLTQERRRAQSLLDASLTFNKAI